VFPELVRQGHIVFYPSSLHIIKQSDVGMDMHIRFVPGLTRRPEGPVLKVNPFLPPDVNLVLVAGFTEQYHLIWNKYAVMEGHVMLVTKNYVPQEAPLGEPDFNAILSFFNEVPSGSLLFYNSGPESGASQPHRHIQFLIFDAPSYIPLHVALLTGQEPLAGVVHEKCFLPPSAQPRDLLALYVDMMARISEYQSYNLLMTTEWMIIVPRRNATYHGISVNALGFSGLFLTRTQQDADILERASLRDLYHTVCYPTQK
jgi:ATP adenylyltransferase